jgi:hypothetical protein
MAIRSYDLLAVGAIAGGVLFSHGIVSALLAQRQDENRGTLIRMYDTAPENERRIVIRRHGAPESVVVVTPRVDAVMKLVPLPETAPTVMTVRPHAEALEGELHELRDHLERYEVEVSSLQDLLERAGEATDVAGDGEILLHDEQGKKRVKVIVKKRRHPEGGGR